MTAATPTHPASRTAFDRTEFDLPAVTALLEEVLVRSTGQHLDDLADPAPAPPPAGRILTDGPHTLYLTGTLDDDGQIAFELTTRLASNATSRTAGTLNRHGALISTGADPQEAAAALAPLLAHLTPGDYDAIIADSAAAQTRSEAREVEKTLASLHFWLGKLHATTLKGHAVTRADSHVRATVSAIVDAGFTGSPDALEDLAASVLDDTPVDRDHGADPVST